MDQEPIINTCGRVSLSSHGPPYSSCYQPSEPLREPEGWHPSLPGLILSSGSVPPQSSRGGQGGGAPYAPRRDLRAVPRWRAAGRDDNVPTVERLEMLLDCLVVPLPEFPFALVQNVAMVNRLKAILQQSFIHTVYNMFGCIHTDMVPGVLGTDISASITYAKIGCD